MDWKRATYGDRLSHALREAKLTASDLARRIGVRPQTISQAIKGSTKQLAADNHMRACLALSVSAMWLATGDGPMREPHSIEVARRVDALPAEDINLFVLLLMVGYAVFHALLRTIALVRAIPARVRRARAERDDAKRRTRLQESLAAWFEGRSSASTAIRPSGFAITGAASGLGRALALHYARLSWRIACLDVLSGSLSPIFRSCRFAMSTSRRRRRRRL